MPRIRDLLEYARTVKSFSPVDFARSTENCSIYKATLLANYGVRRGYLVCLRRGHAGQVGIFRIAAGVPKPDEPISADVFIDNVRRWAIDPKISDFHFRAGVVIALKRVNQ